MKYLRKTPVEAVQWRPDNRTEFDKFVRKYTKDYAYYEYTSGNILLSYWDFNSHKHATKIPKFGWVVREGNTLQFYKDSTFKKTFEEVPDNEHKEVMDAIYKDCEDHVNKILEDINAAIEKRHLMFGKYDNLINPDGRLTKLIDNLFKDDEKTREEIKKNMSEGLKEMAGGKTKGTEFDTFESILDEMKELHAKKDKDYGSAFHKSFEEFGVTAGVVRLNDKMERVKSLVKNGKAEVKDESLLDSLKDMASYAVMLYVELKNKDNG